MSSILLYSEVNGVCILVLLLLAIKIRKATFIQRQRNLLFWVLALNIVFSMLDAVWVFVNHRSFQISIALNWLLNIGYYILSGALGYLWLKYSETVQKSAFASDQKHRIIALLPLLLLALLTLLSPKTGWMFSIDESNRYHRGPAYAIQLLCSYGYIVFTAAKALLLSFQTNDYRKKSELRVLSTYVIPTLLTGISQVFFSEYPILCIGNTIGLLYVYLSLQEQLVSTDPLTKLNNRNQMNAYLSTKLVHLDAESSLYLIMIDADDFKSINDQYGHTEGDHALILIAGALMKACSNRHFFISRYGGDEFAVICDLETNDPIENVCHSIHAELKKVQAPYALTLSMGYARYTPDLKNQQDFIEKADRELYKVKKAEKTRNDPSSICHSTLSKWRKKHVNDFCGNLHDKRHGAVDYRHSLS